MVEQGILGQRWSTSLSSAQSLNERSTPFSLIQCHDMQNPQIVHMKPPFMTLFNPVVGNIGVPM